MFKGNTITVRMRQYQPIVTCFSVVLYLFLQIISCECKILVNGGIVRESVEDNVSSDNETFGQDSEDEFLSKLRYLREIYEPCGGNVDLVMCLKTKSVLLLAQAARAGDMPLAGGVVMLAREASDVTARALPVSELELEADMPQDVEGRNQRLDGLLADGLSTFLGSHVIKLRLPEEALTSVQRSIEEYRGKKNKMAGTLVMMALMMKSMMIPMALGALALLAGKALMVSMMALVLSGVVAIKKLASGSHGGGSTYEVINVPTAHHGHHGRSAHSQAQLLAYSAHNQ